MDAVLNESGQAKYEIVEFRLFQTEPCTCTFQVARTRDDFPLPRTRILVRANGRTFRVRIIQKSSRQVPCRVYASVENELTGVEPPAV